MTANGDIPAARILCHVHNFAMMVKEPVGDADKIKQLGELNNAMGFKSLPNVSTRSKKRKSAGNDDDRPLALKKRKVDTAELGRHNVPQNSVRTLLVSYPAMRCASPVSSSHSFKRVFGFIYNARYFSAEISTF